MLFTSYGFIAFLLAVFVIYYLLPCKKHTQWVFLLVSSFVFYAIADVRFIPFILVTASSAYLAARLLEASEEKKKAYLASHKADMSAEEKKAYKEREKKKKWLLLLALLILDLGILAVTKYLNFTVKTVMEIAGNASDFRPINLIIPMGISFYTFQTVGYVIDVYRGKQKCEKNYFKLLLFVSFFPQLVQGPISRYGELSETLYAPHSFDGKTVSFGVTRILWGFFKKVVLADRILPAVKALSGADGNYTGTYVFITAMFYAFELYCDFTGGIDITIGAAEAMGIRVAENFDLPYFSKNIKEYWNRWHITMGTWFTDYIFYPISVCGPMLKLSKWSREHFGKAVGKRVTVYLSCFVVWFTTGLWHGAAWNFIVWGLMNFVIIMASQELEPLYEKFHKRFHVKGKPLYEGFQIVRTLLMMSFVRMFDVYRDVPMTFARFGSMFTSFNPRVFSDGSLLALGIGGADYVILAVGLVIVFAVSVCKVKVKDGNVRAALYDRTPVLLYTLMALLLVLTLVFGAYGIGYDSSQFIYNQF